VNTINILGVELMEKFGFSNHIKQSFSVCRNGIGGLSRETGVSQVCHEKMVCRDKETKKSQCQDQCQCTKCRNQSIVNQTMVPNKLNRHLLKVVLDFFLAEIVLTGIEAKYAKRSQNNA